MIRPQSQICLKSPFHYISFRENVKSLRYAIIKPNSKLPLLEFESDTARPTAFIIETNVFDDIVAFIFLLATSTWRQLFSCGMV